MGCFTKVQQELCNTSSQLCAKEFKENIIIVKNLERRQKQKYNKRLEYIKLLKEYS